MKGDRMTTLTGQGGRANQKARTRAAIVDACGDLVRSGAEVTMPEVARRALVSEATAYRYFPDLISLLREALEGTWPDPAEALAPLERRPAPAGGPGLDPEAMTGLKRELAVVVSAEAFFVLTDLCGLAPDDAIGRAARTAATVTSAAFAAQDEDQDQDRHPERSRGSPSPPPPPAHHRLPPTTSPRPPPHPAHHLTPPRGCGN